MKAKALLISKEGSESNTTIVDAAARADLLLVPRTDAKRAFDLLRRGLAGIDLVILDVDPGIHAMALLEAITSQEKAPPVIVVTGFEESQMAPIARQHGARACIAKPFSAAELVARIEDVCANEPVSGPRNCDCWGHPYPSRREETVDKCSGDCGGCSADSALAGPGMLS